MKRAQRITDLAIRLERMSLADPEAAHSHADDVLLEALDFLAPEISAAYRALVARAGWWAAA